MREIKCTTCGEVLNVEDYKSVDYADGFEEFEVHSEVICNCGQKYDYYSYYEIKDEPDSVIVLDSKGYEI